MRTHDTRKKRKGGEKGGRPAKAAAPCPSPIPPHLSPDPSALEPRTIEIPRPARILTCPPSLLPFSSSPAFVVVLLHHHHIAASLNRSPPLALSATVPSPGLSLHPPPCRAGRLFLPPRAGDLAVARIQPSRRLGRCPCPLCGAAFRFENREAAPHCLLERFVGLLGVNRWQSKDY